uniref:Orf69 n=1 Tax=Serratia marcescens TaxID=615 RepID=A0A7S7BUY3_SERMA|nr:Orf69 [Serratia marcescens]
MAKRSSYHAKIGFLLAISSGKAIYASRFVNSLFKNDTNHVVYIY